MREVRVRCEWQSEHVLEVPDDAAKIEPNNLDGLLDASGEDVTPELAELTDWRVIDNGPKVTP